MIDAGSRDAPARAQVLLQQSPVAELRDLAIDREGDQLRIHGRVRSFYHKQLAQETVRSVAGDLRLINDVAVD